MKFFELSITSIVLRLYLLMAVVIAAGFTGQWFLAGLALPLFLSIMLGLTFERAARPSSRAVPTGKLVSLDTESFEPRSASPALSQAA